MRQEMSTILSGGEKVEVAATNNISLSRESNTSKSTTVRKFLTDGVFTNCTFKFGVNFLESDDEGGE